MKRLTLIGFAICVVLSGLLYGCARPENSQSASNENAPQNSNSPAETASGGTPLSVQQVPLSPPASSTEAKPAQAPEKPGPVSSPAAGTATGRAPKLVVPEKRVNFGKHPQDKNIVRAITIRNGGKADLKIESVVPS